ncbi:MAG: hypothetical protein Ta2E_08920 [Mycoplasmoidaceae bacterium]|nr:MAG: hypothetical protein Ta2E_08920 [Mycoplasmoidaceae bacterium]
MGENSRVGVNLQTDQSVKLFLSSWECKMKGIKSRNTKMIERMTKIDEFDVLKASKPKSETKSIKEIVPTAFLEYEIIKTWNLLQRKQIFFSKCE